MKNVQIIDGAENCTYSIFALSDDEYAAVFPAPGQNVEFIEDLVKRLGDKGVAQLLTPVWKRPVRKADVSGIHGTLFYQLDFKRKYYPTKSEEEMIANPPKGKSR
jgi:hypothetical protein